jgi:hypothetical protein
MPILHIPSDSAPPQIQIDISLSPILPQYSTIPPPMSDPTAFIAKSLPPLPSPPSSSSSDTSNSTSLTSANSNSSSNSSLSSMSSFAIPQIIITPNAPDLTSSRPILLTPAAPHHTLFSLTKPISSSLPHDGTQNQGQSLTDRMRSLLKQLADADRDFASETERIRTSVNDTRVYMEEWRLERRMRGEMVMGDS